MKSRGGIAREPYTRNQEPVAFDQRSRPRSKSPRSLEPRDTSFYKLLRSRSCCLFSHTAAAIRDSRELSYTRNPIVILACNFNQSCYIEPTSRPPLYLRQIPDYTARGVVLLQDCRFSAVHENCTWISTSPKKYARYVRRGIRCPRCQIDHTSTDRASKHPRCVRDN